MKAILAYIGICILLVFMLNPTVEAQKKALDEANPIKIGYINPFTGPATLNTYTHLPGCELAIEEINDAGGVLGRPLKLITRDEKLNPEIALREAKDLIGNEKVFWIQGITSSACSRVISEYCKSKKVICVGESGSKSPKLTAEWGHRYYFRNTSNHLMESQAIAMGSVKIFGPLKKLYNISPDYEGGHASWEAFLHTYKKFVPDAKVVGEIWHKLGTQDYTSYLTAIMNSDAELVYTGSYQTDRLTMIKQSEAIGLNGKIPWVGHYDAIIEICPKFNKDFYPKKTVGGACYSFWAIDKPESKKFVERIREKYGGVYPGYALNGYSWIRTMAKVIEKVGALDTEKVINALEGIIQDTPIGPVEMRACDHQGMWPFYAGLIGPLPGYEFYSNTNVIAIGSEAYLPCEEVLKLRGK